MCEGRLAEGTQTAWVDGEDEHPSGEKGASHQIPPHLLDLGLISIPLLSRSLNATNISAKQGRSGSAAFRIMMDRSAQHCELLNSPA
jgi:hypothetical protein